MPSSPPPPKKIRVHQPVEPTTKPSNSSSSRGGRPQRSSIETQPRQRSPQTSPVPNRRSQPTVAPLPKAPDDMDDEDEHPDLLELEGLHEELGQRQFSRLFGQGVFEQWDPDIWAECQAFLRLFSSSTEFEGKVQTPLLFTSIFDYQMYAAWWIWRNKAQMARSSLLADEMGLGKTFTVWTALVLHGVVYGLQRRHAQCTAALCRAPSKRSLYAACPAQTRDVPALTWSCIDKPTLIIVPPAAIETWHREFAQRVTRNILDLHVLHHRTKRPEDLLNILGANKGHVVVLTTYQSLASRIFDGDRGRPPDFGLVICDEIHEYRSLDSRFASHIGEFHQLGAKFWFVTGTPIPKGVSSIGLIYHHLCSVEAPAALEAFSMITKDFYQIENAVDTRNHRSCAETRAQAYRSVECLAKEVSNLLLPYTIRRERSTTFNGHLILELPPMEEFDVPLPFVSSPWEDEYLDKYFAAMARQELIATDAKRRRKDGPRDYLSRMHIQRVTASLPSLLKTPTMLSNTPIKELLSFFADPKLIQSLERSSAKLQWLRDHCEKMNLPKRSGPPPTSPEHGPKLPVFVYSPVEAIIVTQFLRYLGYAVGLLHREMKASERDDVVNRMFRAPPTTRRSCPILVTTVALGGKVYTMTEATTCIIFSPQYIQASELQAKHRILRIGQQHATTCYRLVALRTIEPLIIARQRLRSEFDDAVFGRYRKGEEVLPAQKMMVALLEASAKFNKPDEHGRLAPKGLSQPFDKDLPRSTSKAEANPAGNPIEKRTRSKPAPSPAQNQVQSRTGAKTAPTPSLSTDKGGTTTRPASFTIRKRKAVNSPPAGSALPTTQKGTPAQSIWQERR